MGSTRSLFFPFSCACGMSCKKCTWADWNMQTFWR